MTSTIYHETQGGAWNGAPLYSLHDEAGAVIGGAFQNARREDGQWVGPWVAWRDTPHGRAHGRGETREAAVAAAMLAPEPPAPTPEAIARDAAGEKASRDSIARRWRASHDAGVESDARRRARNERQEKARR